jgi:hypothetical protein
MLHYVHTHSRRTRSPKLNVGAHPSGFRLLLLGTRFNTAEAGNISKALSDFRHTYAMVGVDDVIEVKILTGDYLTDSFALRGGGGGTYCIITSVTYRAFLSMSSSRGTNTQTLAVKISKCFLSPTPPT